MTELVPNPRPDITPIVGTIEGTCCDVYNWEGTWMATGPGHSTHILDEFKHRMRTIKQNMFVIVGPPGNGKTYFGLRLAKILDPKFNPVIQVVFEPSQFLYLIGPSTPLKMHQVILIDESQFAMSARNWFLDVQKEVMQHAAAVRNQGFVIIIINLHQTLLDKTLRAFVLSHLIDMKDRGKGLVYSMYFPTFADKPHQTRMGMLELQLPDYEYCNAPTCLKCPSLRDTTYPCYTMRAVYERMKTAFLAKKNLESEAKSRAKEGKNKLDLDAMVEQVIAYKDMIKFKPSAKGGVVIESIRRIFEKKYNKSIQKSTASIIVERGAIDYPDIFVKPVKVKEENE